MKVCLLSIWEIRIMICHLSSLLAVGGIRRLNGRILTVKKQKKFSDSKKQLSSFCLVRQFWSTRPAVVYWVVREWLHGSRGRDQGFCDVSTVNLCINERKEGNNIIKTKLWMTPFFKLSDLLDKVLWLAGQPFFRICKWDTWPESNKDPEFQWTWRIKFQFRNSSSYSMNSFNSVLGLTRTSLLYEQGWQISASQKDFLRISFSIAINYVNYYKFLSVALN